MACDISDLAVAGIGDPPATITVNGRAQDCSKVIVTLVCGGSVVSQSVDVVAGVWSVEFDAPAGCACGENVLVKVECEGDPGCREVVEGPLECRPSDEECPNIGDVIAVVSDRCNDDGTRAVTLTVHVVNDADDAVLEWTDFGDGVPGLAFVVAAGDDDDFSSSHDYEPGQYVAVLTVISPEGCAGTTVAVDVPECPMCLERNQVEVTISECRAGRRDVTFTFPREITATLDFGDGDEAGFTGTRQTHSYTPSAGAYTALLTVEGCDDLEIPVQIDECPGCLTPEDVIVEVSAACDANGRRLVTFRFPGEIEADLAFGDDFFAPHFTADNTSHAYVAPGDYTATLMQGGCAPIQIPVHVESCPCLTREDVTVTVGACNADGTRDVTFDFPRAIAGELDFGDNSPSAGFQGSRQSHRYAAGAYTVTLAVEGCDAVNIPVDVAACPGAGGGGAGDGEPSACGSLTLVVAALLGLALSSAMLLFVLQVCRGINVPWFLWLIPAAFAVAAAVVVALWYLFCDPPTRCDWLAIGWMTSLASGIVALYLSNCCPGIGAVTAAGLFAAAVAMFAVWIATCHPDGCQVFDYLAVAVVTGAGSVISFLVIPLVAALIAPCAMPWVAAVAGVVGGGLVAAAAACHAAVG